MTSSELNPAYIWFVGLLSDNLIMAMTILFFVALVLRVLIYLNVKRQYWFVQEFQNRVQMYLIDKHEDKKLEKSFFTILRYNLEKTYYEIFDLRDKNHRRKLDRIHIIWDRIFHIKKGCAEFIIDFLHQIRYLKLDRTEPQFIDKSKASFNNNKTFGKIFGFIPAVFFDETLQKLPSIFVIGGIFGTFLGIMYSLPDLARIDISDAVGSKEIMNSFLMKISFAMNTSIVGIIYSVSMNFLNATMGPDNLVYSLMNNFSSSVDILWNKSENNNLSEKEITIFESAIPISIKGRLHEIPAEKILHSSTRRFYADDMDDDWEEEEGFEDEEDSSEDKSA